MTIPLPVQTKSNCGSKKKLGKQKYGKTNIRAGINTVECKSIGNLFRGANMLVSEIIKIRGKNELI